MALAASAAVGSRWKTLHNAIAGKHSSVDRKVTAHHEGPHGGVLLGQDTGFISQISLILSAVDQDMAGISTSVAMALVGRVHPSSSSAKT